MEDREGVAKQLSDAMATLPTSDQDQAARNPGEVGGQNALQAMKSAFTSNDNALRDASSRLLGNWANVEAGPTLLELAQLPPSVYTTRAIALHSPGASVSRCPMINAPRCAATR